MIYTVYKHLILPGQVNCAWWLRIYLHGFCEHSWWLLGDLGFASKSFPCGVAVLVAMSCQGHQICLGCQSKGMTECCSQWPSRLGHLITLIIAVHLERAALRGEMFCNLNESSFQPLMTRGGKRNSSLIVACWNSWILPHSWKWLYWISETVGC